MGTASGTSFKKKVTKGKTYYVKVRAVKKNSKGKTVYGAYSDVKHLRRHGCGFPYSGGT
jgi:endo-1,4-beta-xylanase